MDEAEKAYRSALVAAQSAVKHDGIVHKDGWNTHGRYNYVGHEQVMASCRAALLQAGLAVEASTGMAGPAVLEIPRADKTVLVWSWTVDIPVSHSAGHRETYRVVVTTQANDKAAFVASTSADRTLRMRLCGLAGSEEDPENDSQDRSPPAAADPLASWRQRLASCGDPAQLAEWFVNARRQLNDGQRRSLGAALKARAQQLGTSIEALTEAAA